MSTNAIQPVINREWGLAKNENPNQGAFIIDELTVVVEEAVLKQSEAISGRGGAPGSAQGLARRVADARGGASHNGNFVVEDAHGVSRSSGVKMKIHHLTAPKCEAAPKGRLIAS